MRLNRAPLWTALGFSFVFLVVLSHLGCAASESYTENAQPGDRFHVGYSVIDLKIPGDDKAKTLTVAVWYPTAQIPQKHAYGGPTSGKVAIDAKPYKEQGTYPLLVFSHGYGGSGLGAVFFTEALAAQGWIVVAPDHNDRHTAVRIKTGQKRQYDRLGLLRHAKQIGQSGPEDRQAYSYRLDEMKLALDWIRHSEPFGELIDKEKIAVGGHSFGGFTALGLCGTIKERHEDRIKGVLLFSTGAGGYLFRQDELRSVKMPSMVFLGEREKSHKRGTQTMAELADKVYRNLAAPKYFLEIKEANHFSFNNRFTNRLAGRFMSGTEEQFDVIRRYAIAFLEKHIAGSKGPYPLLEQADPLLVRYFKEPDKTLPRTR